jgi:O-methyltransferase domain/Dimerisation domain
MSENIAAGPEESAAPWKLLQMMTGYWVTQAIYAAAKLGIADLLEKAPLHCDELANRTKCDASSLYRTLRALASVGIFTEIAPREFAITPLAALLRTTVPNSMRSLAIMYAEEQYRAWGEMLYSVRTGQPAFEHQFGMGVFEYFAQNPAAGTIFNEAMSGLTSQTADAFAKAYNFSAFKTIVDVGGNLGTMLAAILREYPLAQGILFDRPNVVATAAEHFAKAGLDKRCRCVAGDFFASVPTGGDAYLLAAILHDWDDDRCLAILTKCREVMPAHGKLLVVEFVLPAGDVPHPGKWLDLHMLVMAGGRERTQTQYKDLFISAGFNLTQVSSLPSGQSVLEAVPV